MNNNLVEKKENKLKNLLIIFIFLCFIQIFFIGIFDLFNQMFLILFIFLVIYYKNNIFIPQITIFFILIQLIFELFASLLIIQNYYLNLIINLPKMIFLFKLAFIIIYFLLLKTTFELYKEYKIEITTEGNYNYQNLNDIEMNNNYYNNNNNNYNNNNNNKGYVPFQGQGYTWG